MNARQASLILRGAILAISLGLFVARILSYYGIDTIGFDTTVLPMLLLFAFINLLTPMRH